MSKHDKRADILMAQIFSLGDSLGIAEREMTRAALTAVVFTAEKQGDPDGYIKKLGEQATKQAAKKGAYHG